MEYKVVTSSLPESLELSVNMLCKEGWRPLGGISSVGVDRGDYEITVLRQAMVREETERADPDPRQQHAHLFRNHLGHYITMESRPHEGRVVIVCSKCGVVLCEDWL
jgi:hypothetical protein